MTGRDDGVFETRPARDDGMESTGLNAGDKRRRALSLEKILSDILSGNPDARF